MSEPRADLAQAPSSWVRRWLPLAKPGGEALDLACGSGRHARLLAARGLRVCAVDRDAQALALLAGISGVRTLRADLEADPWPFSGLRFDCVIVTNYLHRPLFPAILDALSVQGVLIYETFALGNERFGRPSNPAHLLRPGELLEVVRGRLRVVAFEDWYVEVPKPAMIQRLVACAGALQPGPGLAAAGET
ncbi:MAG TPA: class I SAM-dependent methyltransferase [Burkholderiales bacterium]|nr:class I SAM-dependent methyltransferase [Burkholderiales bacterium]